MKTTIDLPKSLYQSIQSRSKREGRPLSVTLSGLLREALAAHRKISPGSRRRGQGDDHREWRNELLE